MSNDRGAALPIVLFFALIASITVTIYVFSQYSLNRPYLRTPINLQSLLTARSGIWFGLSLINNQNVNTESAPQARIDGEFGADLFDTETDAARDAGEDTAVELLLDVPVLINPFLSEQYGIAELTLSSAGLARSLSSTADFRGTRRQVRALLGGRSFTDPDTVIFTQTPVPPEGGGLVDGRVGLIPAETDSAGGDRRNRFNISERELKEFIDEHESALTRRLDTAFAAPPLTITHSDDLGRVGAVVPGALILDASLHTIRWKGDRTIQVLGDLQMDGDILVEGLTFVVAGEIRLGVGDFSGGDEVQLKGVTLFSRSRIFFATNVVFDGSALALGEIEIYRNARIVNGSMVASNAVPKESKKARQSAQPEDSSSTPAPGAPFTIFVRNEATIDGVVLNLTKRGGIQTGEDTFVRGILWAEGRICHQGRMEGVMKAKAFVGVDAPLDLMRNVVTGSVKRLDAIGDYHLPYFVGEMTILEWYEG